MSATTTRMNLNSPAAPPALSAPSKVALDTEARGGLSAQNEFSYGTYISMNYIQQTWLSLGVSHTILAPLERVKFVMQTQKELVRHGTLTREFYSTWDCVRYLSMVEGNRSFWRGNLVQVVSLFPILLSQQFIYIPVELFIYSIFPPHSAFSCTVGHYTAIFGGYLAMSLISYPLEFARFRLAVDVKSCKGAPYAFRHSLAFFSQPILSEFTPYLYRGLMLLLLGSLVYMSVYTVCFNLMTYCIPPEDGRWYPIVLQTVAGFGIAGVATLCLHPIDLIRRRMMIAVTSDRFRYPTAMSCVRRIAEKEGLRGFYRGGTVAIVRMLAVTGLFNIRGLI